MHTNTAHQRILASWHPGHLHANPSCYQRCSHLLNRGVPASALPDQPCVANAPTDGMKVMFLTARAGRWARRRGCPAGMQEFPRVWEMEALSWRCRPESHTWILISLVILAFLLPKIRSGDAAASLGSLFEDLISLLLEIVHKFIIMNFWKTY